MPTVLVVDDSHVDRLLAGQLLSRGDGMTVDFAENGAIALEAIRQSPPDLVVSDLQMPEKNGLELVEAVRDEYPGLPVILMTARGSESIAIEALRRGAAGYIPKSSLAEQLTPTVEAVLEAMRADRQHTRVMHALSRIECRFVLRNDAELIPALVAHVQEMLRCMPLGHESERLRVGRAVGQALWIAHEHGNLELPLDSQASDAAFQELGRTRRSERPWSDRTLELHAAVTPAEAVFTIDYAGPPIRTGELPQNLQEEAVDRHWLSRFVFLPAVMDDIEFLPEESRLILRKRPSAATAGQESLEVA